MDLISLVVSLVALGVGTYDWFRLRSMVREMEQDES